MKSVSTWYVINFDSFGMQYRLGSRLKNNGKNHIRNRLLVVSRCLIAKLFRKFPADVINLHQICCVKDWEGGILIYCYSFWEICYFEQYNATLFSSFEICIYMKLFISGLCYLRFREKDWRICFPGNSFYPWQMSVN